jgi:hypothetical protein
MTQQSPIADEDRAFLADWDEEIEREFADELVLRRQVAHDGRAVRERAYLEQASVRAALLQLAGMSEGEARERADQELIRVREAAAAQRATASGIVRRRTATDRAETAQLIATVREA